MADQADSVPADSNEKFTITPMGGENAGEAFVDCYMDRVDFECELGMAAGGNKVYASVDDIKQSKPCIDSCGIVKVRVQFLELIEPGDTF